MSQFTVTVLDTTGIQPYIFGSNKLRENIGASYLVKQSTKKWVEDVLNDLKKEFQGDIHIPNDESPEAKPYIENGNLIAELIYAGGGNAVLLFQSPEIAIEFTKRLSKKILIEAPGINLVVAHKHQFDWEKTSLYETIQDLMKNELDRKKQARIPSSPLLGLGITTDCQSTRLVAVNTSDQCKTPTSYPVSKEIEAKLNNVEKANKDVKETIFDREKPNPYTIPKDFDDFGRSQGEMSYIAVVHADGNNMGKRFQQFGKDRTNRDYITAMRQLSSSVQQAGIKALKATVKLLTDNIEQLQKELDLKGKNLIPFRPLVYGGDDVTFVCDGRLGLELATTYLKEFEKQTIADNQPIFACAGVCIVKVHYPFARAYEMSESLCKNAKLLAKKDEGKCSTIDWHIASSGLIGSLSEIREREYHVKAGSLTMRPLRVTESTDQWQTWSACTQVIQEFQHGENWSGRNNKIKALRDVLRQGEEATKLFLQSYGLKNLPIFSSKDGNEETLLEKGWLNGICGYFDSIEAMEFYLSLEGELC